MRAARVLLFSALLLNAGCAELLGRLRPDLDDGYAYEEEPVRGGFLSEQGYVASEPSRSLASENGSEGWVDRMNQDSNNRDRLRGPASRGGPSFDEESGDSEAEVRPLPQQPRRLTRNDFVDDAQEAGSLWSTNGQTNFFFSKNKTRTPGDLISINIEADLLRDLAAEVKRALKPEERDYELSLLEKPTEKKEGASTEAKSETKGDQIKQTSAAADVDARAAYSKVDLTGAIGAKAGDTFLAEIVERYPNGNYKIRGTKRLAYRGSTKLMTLVGVVRGADLTDDDKVNSGRLYEYRLEVVR